MLLAGVDASGAGGTDHLLAAVAARLQEEGLSLLGALRVNIPDTGTQFCETTLGLLPHGPDIRITQDLGSGSGACRMDAGAIEDVVGIATARLRDDSCDIVLLNKFGLSEAEGRGFRTLIAEALARDIPVLIGVSNTHRAAFDQFAGGTAKLLPPLEDVVVEWCRCSIAQGRNTAAPG
ncbi:DUF2478 domain-containing protein [Ruegeria arenilitoris]|uniref:DUF2478 domain-containing protein n=1 Tax=Ruegeria arenilitoris TaxID=1173585 RepID=UPI00147AB5A0|nr:DUF2478 domain-containing protein [Ruegeria arenilitoris]